MLKHKKVFSMFSSDNLSKAKEFYGNMLRLKINETKEGLELHYGTEGLTFIYPKSNHIPATHTVLSFVVDNIEETVDELNKIGIRFEQYEGELKTDEKGIHRGKTGPKVAWFKDPAGNILSVVED